MDKREHNKKIGQEVLELKSELEAKLGAINEVVDRIGLAAKRPSRKRDRRSGLDDVVRESAAQQREWRLQQQAQENGRLPAIREGKHWPRRTLSGNTFGTVNATDISDSPDLGPPPVAHFDVSSDPIKFDRSPPPPSAANAVTEQGGKESEDERSEGEMAMLNMTSNLERRRKRRVSSYLEDIAKAADEDHGKMTAPATSPTKASTEDEGGAKMSENTAAETKMKPSSTRRISSTNSSIASRLAKENQMLEAKLKASSEKDNADSEKDVPAARKPLGAKSTNSPSKPRRSTTNTTMTDKISARRGEVAKTTQLKEQQRRDRKSSSVKPKPDTETEQQQQQQQPDDLPQQDLPPKTPSLDLFSPSLSSTDPPLSSEPPSTKQPSEMASTTASLEEVTAPGRGSRRARSAISYAEPNLRDKMRRPGKEFVDAVIGADPRKAREGSIGSKREGSVESTRGESNGVRTVTIKKEKPEDATSWKDLPKASTADESDEEAKSPLVDKTGRSKQLLPHPSPSASASADADATALALSKLSIFDGPPSSSCSPQDDTHKHQAPAHQQPSRSKIIAAEASSRQQRVGRRHSTAHISSTATNRPLPKPTTAANGAKKRTFDESDSNDGGHSSTTTISSKPAAVNGRTGKAVLAAAAAAGERNGTVRSVAEGGVGLGSRRRSMML